MTAGQPTQEVHEHGEPDPESVQLVEVPRDSMVDTQVATARRYPRSVTKFRKEVLALACLDEETAGSCMYALPRGGKSIEGPSARFAEILLYSWGNSRAEARVLEEGPTHLKAEGTFYDLERNVGVRKVIQRRITNKAGRRFDDDMIAVTGNAANSIALRNAIFAGIPKALWKSMYEQARLASIGKAGTLTQTRQKMLEHFAKMGVTAEKIFGLLGVEGIEDIKEDHCITMRGLSNAIRDGEVTVEDTFSQRATGSGDTPDLNSRIKDATGKKPESSGAK